MANYQINKPKNWFSCLSLNPNFEISAYIAKFNQLITDLDRVNFVYADLKKHNLCPKVKTSKNDNRAKARREAGNDEFRRGNIERALSNYTSAVLTAKTSKELALAYANRSACLFKLRKFQECINDIERALANDYNGNQKKKLNQRRIKAENLLTKPPEPIHTNILKISGKRKHPHIQCAKNCIDVKNDEFGKRVVANRDIEIGEVLSVENPFVLYQKENSFRCDTCLKLCHSMIPCENCIHMKFCSEACRDAARDYHKYECPVYDCLLSLSESESIILALRLTVSGYRFDCYQELLDLPTTDERPVDELLHFAITAALLFDLLEKHTSFFVGATDKDIFKRLIFRNLEIASVYKLEVGEIRPSRQFFGESLGNLTVFAWGMYSFSTLFRHSCCPNVTSIQYENKMVLRAIKSVRKGEECCVSYGVTYEKASRTERQINVLKSRLHFCKCEACENNWCVWDDPLPFKFPLHVDLGMSESEFKSMKRKLVDADISATVKYLPLIIKRFRRLERFEPWGNSLEIKKLVVLCFRNLGNKQET